MKRVGEHEDVEQLGAGSRSERVQALPQPKLELVGSHRQSFGVLVTRRVTVCPSYTVLTRPTSSRQPSSTSGNGQDGTSRDLAGHAGLPSQGGDPGSNPVGTTNMKPQVRELVLNRSGG